MMGLSDRNVDGYQNVDGGKRDQRQDRCVVSVRGKGGKL